MGVVRSSFTETPKLARLMAVEGEHHFDDKATSEKGKDLERPLRPLRVGTGNIPNPILVGARDLASTDNQVPSEMQCHQGIRMRKAHQHLAQHPEITRRPPTHAFCR